VNLATAKSASRVKEVGIRKVSGVSKAGLIMQFLSESWLAVGKLSDPQGSRLQSFEGSQGRIESNFGAFCLPLRKLM